MSIIGAAAVGAGAMLGSAGASLSGSKRQQKRQIRHDLDMQKRNFEYSELSAKNAYDRQLEQWNRENEYNRFGSIKSRLEEDGGSIGLLYGGASGAQTAGGLSSVSTGTGKTGSSSNLQGAGYINNLTSAMEQLGLGAQIDVMRSQANKNNADAEFVRGSKTDESGSRTDLNYALAGNARARTTGQELDNALDIGLNPLKLRQAEKNLETSEALLRKYAKDLEKTQVDLDFSKVTFDDRANVISQDLDNKMSQMAVNYARVEMLKVGKMLTGAQAEELQYYLERLGRTGIGRNGSLSTNVAGFVDNQWQAIKGATADWIRDTRTAPANSHKGAVGSMRR